MSKILDLTIIYTTLAYTSNKTENHDVYHYDNISQANKIYTHEIRVSKLNYCITPEKASTLRTVRLSRQQSSPTTNQRIPDSVPRRASSYASAVHSLRTLLELQLMCSTRYLALAILLESMRSLA